MLTATGLGRFLGGRWLFRELDFQLGCGDVLVVRGANGSGKSSLLRVLVGLDAPQRGTILRPLRVGYAALDQALYPKLTLIEHLHLAVEVRGCGSAGLPDGVNLPLDQPLEAFSSGMRARARLLLATAHEPELLLLDEPGASMDEAGHAWVAGLVEAQRHRGVTVIATNDPSEAELATHEVTL